MRVDDGCLVGAEPHSGLALKSGSKDELVGDGAALARAPVAGAGASGQSLSWLGW